MIFRKRKRMVDIRKLQKRGVVRIPINNVEIPTNKEGFVELGKTEPKSSSMSNNELFGFTETTNPTETFSEPADSSLERTQTEGYDKREIDEKMINLDNKIYKLENRIELLEKKLDIEQPSDSNFGAMGW